MDFIAIKTINISRNNNNLEPVGWPFLQALLLKNCSPPEYIVTICMNEIITPSISRRSKILKEYLELIVGGHQTVTKLYTKYKLEQIFVDQE